MIAPCYYIIHLVCFICIYMLFYMIFGTNLLTQSPVPVSVFPLFQCFTEKEYQTGSKRNETFGKVIFGKKAIQETWSARQGINKESTRQGARPPPWACPPPSWAPRGSPDVFLPPIYIYISIYPKTTEEHNRWGVPPPEAPVATESQSRPVPAPCRGAISLRWPSSSSRCSP